MFFTSLKVINLSRFLAYNCVCLQKVPGHPVLGGGTSLSAWVVVVLCDIYVVFVVVLGVPGLSAQIFVVRVHLSELSRAHSCIIFGSVTSKATSPFDAFRLLKKYRNNDTR